MMSNSNVDSTLIPKDLPLAKKKSDLSSHLAKAQSLIESKDYKNAFKFANLALQESTPNSVEKNDILAFVAGILQLMRNQKEKSFDSLIDALSSNQTTESEKIIAVNDIRSFIHHSPHLVTTEIVIRLVELTNRLSISIAILNDISKLNIHSKTITQYIDTPEIYKKCASKDTELILCIDLFILHFNIDSQLNPTSLTSFQSSVYRLFFQHTANFLDLSNIIQTKLLQGIAYLIQSIPSVELFCHNESYIHMLLASTESLQHRGFITAILAKLYDSHSNKTPILIEILQKFIFRGFESINQRENLSAITALHSISIASPSTGKLLYIEDVVYLFLLNGALELQTVVLEFLFEIATDKSTKIKLSAKYGALIKLYSIEHSDSNLNLLSNSLCMKLNSFNVKENTDSAMKINDLIRLLSNDAKNNSAATVIETLVFLTSQGSNKEILIAAENLKPFVQYCLKSQAIHHYGLAAIISNLTQYKQALSDEEQNLEKLKRMSVNELAKVDDPLDDDQHTTHRCHTALLNGIVIVLNNFGKSPSAAMEKILASIFINITRDASKRGIIIQQGGVKTMMHLSECTGDVGMDSAQSLARLGITNDPIIAYKGQRIIEMVRPFLRLLDSEETLKQFESLMALTNLAGVGGEVMAKFFTSKGMQKIECLLLSDNFMVRRAATECLSNMLYDDAVYQWYTEKCMKCASVTDILLAFCDLDDLKTRYAASAALSVLTVDEKVARVVCESKRLKNLVVLIEEDDDGLVLRGIESIKNICKAGLGSFIDKENGTIALRVLVEHENSSIAQKAIESIAYLNE